MASKSKLQNSIAIIEQKVGAKEIVQPLGGPGIIKKNIEVIPTGSVGLDIALGIMGLPRGRIVELYGPESSGKTTLALSIAASCQNTFVGEPIGIVDAEHALDSAYAESIGIDTSNALINQPDNGEQGLAVVQSMVEDLKLPYVLVDSVAALTPKAEIEGEMGDQFVGLQARMMSQAMRKLTSIASKSKTCIVFINQIREKVGVSWGSPEMTPGGRALKFHASVRIDIRRIGGVKGGTGLPDVGNNVRARVVKNKMAPPFREAEFPITFGYGIDQALEAIDLGVKTGVLEVRGSWFNMDGKRMANGRAAMVELLRDHVYLDELQKKIINKVTEGQE